MRVLFVSSGRLGEPSPLVKNQGQSLVKVGVDVEYSTIEGKGVAGYLRAIPKLRERVKTGKYDVVHAHYSFSAFTASLAGLFPLVVSLMGSDVYMSVLWRGFAKLFYWFRWNATIVKTERMKELLSIPNAHVIPNGVDLERFRPIDKETARKEIKYDRNKKLIIFISSPSRPEKNFALAQEAINRLKDSDVELMAVYNVKSEIIPYHINAADALILTSKWEGGVNVIKEAMACNCPIVTTDVGDVKWVIGQTEGCFVCNHNASDLADKIKLALAFGRKTNGRDRILELGLDSDTVAQKLIHIYKSIKR